MEFIFKKISDFYEKGDVSSLSWSLIIIAIIMIFKFIFSNNIKNNDKNSEFSNNALKAHLKVLNDIFLYKNQKVDSIYLITSLNELQYYNNIDYLYLLKDITTYNIKNKIIELEVFINRNIDLLKREQNYVINTNKINDLEKISIFIKNTNIKIFINSIIATFSILYLSIFSLNLILMIEEINNLFYKTYSIFFIIFMLFNISLIYFKIDNYMNKKNYCFVSLIIFFNLILIFIMIFIFKVEVISKYAIFKSVLLFISLIISFIFSIKIDYISSKFRNIKSNIINYLKK